MRAEQALTKEEEVELSKFTEATFEGLSKYPLSKRKIILKKLINWQLELLDKECNQMKLAVSDAEEEFKSYLDFISTLPK